MNRTRDEVRVLVSALRDPTANYPALLAGFNLADNFYVLWLAACVRRAPDGVR
jgi:hypothetical protein